MDAMDLLTRQHRDVEGLLGEIATSRGQERYALIEEVADIMAIHFELEEQILYPTARTIETRRSVDDNEEEHQQMKRLVSELLDSEPDNQALFGEPFQDLTMLFRSHFDDEDRGLFQDVRAGMDGHHLRAMTDKMVNLAEQLADESDVVDRVYESGGSTPP